MKKRSKGWRINDLDVWERIKFFRKEFGKSGRDDTFNNVIRKLMVEAGWLKE